jgi:hypothetical protein
VDQRLGPLGSRVRRTASIGGSASRVARRERAGHPFAWNARGSGPLDPSARAFVGRKHVSYEKVVEGVQGNA